MPEQNQEQTVNSTTAPLPDGFIAASSQFIEYIMRLEARIVALEHKVGINTSVQSQNSGVPEVKKEDCFYCLGVTQGIFSKPTQAPEEFSIYRFVKIDENKASVYIENNLNAVKKFSSNTKAQETACEPQNSCPSTLTGIETVEPGVASFDGKEWSIKSKVKIKYLG